MGQTDFQSFGKQMSLQQYRANKAIDDAANASSASSAPSLPALAAPPPDAGVKTDPLIGRTQNLGTARIAAPDLKNGSKTLLGG